MHGKNKTSTSSRVSNIVVKEPVLVKEEAPDPPCPFRFMRLNPRGAVTGTNNTEHALKIYALPQVRTRHRPVLQPALINKDMQIFPTSLAREDGTELEALQLAMSRSQVTVHAVWTG